MSKQELFELRGNGAADADAKLALDCHHAAPAHVLKAIERARSPSTNTRRHSAAKASSGILAKDANTSHSHSRTTPSTAGIS